MHFQKKCALVLWLVAIGGIAKAEESWLDAEIRAQEARWSAQQDKSALPQLIIPPVTRQSTHRAKTPERERNVTFPALAFSSAARAILERPSTSSPEVMGRERGLQRRLLRDFSEPILAAATQHGIDPLLIRAVMLTESSGNHRARSPKGAIGLMQLMPATATRFGVTDPYDPIQNINGGARYLRWLLDYFDGNVRLALAGYNAGEHRVNQYSGVPPFRETQNYVIRVQSHHQALKLAASLNP